MNADPASSGGADSLTCLSTAYHRKIFLRAPLTVKSLFPRRLTIGWKNKFFLKLIFNRRPLNNEEIASARRKLNYIKQTYGVLLCPSAAFSPQSLQSSRTSVLYLCLGPLSYHTGVSHMWNSAAARPGSGGSWSINTLSSGEKVLPLLTIVLALQ